VLQIPRSWALLWIRFNYYAKNMYIIVGISKKWEGISNDWGIVSGLPNKVSSKPRWQFEGRCYNEMLIRPLSNL
jgi:hypothetical protein